MSIEDKFKQYINNFSDLFDEIYLLYTLFHYDAYDIYECQDYFSFELFTFHNEFDNMKCFNDKYQKIYTSNPNLRITSLNLNLEADNRRKYKCLIDTNYWYDKCYIIFNKLYEITIHNFTLILCKFLNEAIRCTHSIRKIIILSGQVDLKLLEYFPNLKHVVFKSIDAVSLDGAITSNTSIETVEIHCIKCDSNSPHASCLYTSLTYLTFIKNLVNLHISNSKCNIVAGILLQFPKLQSIILNSVTNVTSFKNIATLKYLHSFTCNHSKITDLTFLAGPPNLKYLDCSNNNINNLTGIKNITTLEELNCSNNKLKSIDYITELINLDDVNCSKNNINTLPNMSNMQNLVVFDCHSNNITDITPLNNCQILEELNVSNNNIKEMKYIKLPVLDTLNCSNNPLVNLPISSNISSIDKLQYTYNDCHMYIDFGSFNALGFM